MKTIITGMLILTLGAGVAYANLDDLGVPSLLDSVSAKQFAKMNGISDIVYDCAVDVLGGKNADELKNDFSCLKVFELVIILAPNLTLEI